MRADAREIRALPPSVNSRGRVRRKGAAAARAVAGAGDADLARPALVSQVAARKRSQMRPSTHPARSRAGRPTVNSLRGARMLHRSVRHVFVLFAGLALARCDFLDPAGAAEITHFKFQLELEAEEVAPGDTVDASALVINEGFDVATITVPAECFGTLALRRDGVDQDFRSEPEPCWAAGPEVTVEAGDTLVHTWSIETATAAGAPLPAGEYDVHVDLNGRLPRGLNVPDIVRRLVIVATE